MYMNSYRLGPVFNVDLFLPPPPSLSLLQGHACPILYAAWCEAGLLSEEHLLTLRKVDSILEGHPTPVSNSTF